MDKEGALHLYEYLYKSFSEYINILKNIMEVSIKERWYFSKKKKTSIKRVRDLR